MPPRPGPGLPRSDDDKAQYTGDLRGAYLDCKGTVDAIAVRRKALDDAAAKGKVSGFHLSIPFIGKKAST